MHTENTQPNPVQDSFTGVKIRVAQRRDIETALALIEELLAELGGEGREFARVQREKLRADADSNLDSGRFLALLAKDESGTAVGVLTLSASFALYAGGDYGTIDEMYVRPGYRGVGIGRQLVQAAVAIARERGWYRLDVTGPADQRDERAMRFYERLGFEFTGPKLRLLT